MQLSKFFVIKQPDTVSYLGDKGDLSDGLSRQHSFANAKRFYSVSDALKAIDDRKEAHKGQRHADKFDDKVFQVVECRAKQ